MDLCHCRTEYKVRKSVDSPGQHNNEIHHVPTVTEVGAFVKSKAKCNDLNPSLKAKYANKVGLCVILQERNKKLRCEIE